MTRLADKRVTVSWTETEEILVGYHNCCVCQAETPDPTAEQLLEFAQRVGGDSLMWPDANTPGRMPTGWHREVEEGSGFLCPDCWQAKQTAFAPRRRPRKETTP